MTVWGWLVTAGGWIDAVFTWVAGKAPVVTAVAASIGAYIAVKSYHKWLPETVGKRKIELAEDLLADFHQVRGIIAWARNPGGFGSEGNTRPSAESEEADEKSIKNSYYRTIERLHAGAEVFSRLQSKKYRAIAYFGPEAGKPFQDLKEIHSRIMTAASMLIRTYRKDGKQPPSWDKWEAIIGWGPEDEADDTIVRQVDDLVGRVETFYGRWLMREIPKSSKSH